jgi:hypothetical protein
MKTEAEKLDQLGAWLGEAATETGEADDVAVVGDRVVVATARGGAGPALEVYDRDYAARWHDAIASYILADPDCTTAEAVEASRPK